MFFPFNHKNKFIICFFKLIFLHPNLLSFDCNAVHARRTRYKSPFDLNREATKIELETDENKKMFSVKKQRGCTHEVDIDYNLNSFGNGLKKKRLIENFYLLTF